MTQIRERKTKEFLLENLLQTRNNIPQYQISHFLTSLEVLNFLQRQLGYAVSILENYKTTATRKTAEIAMDKK